MSTATSPFHFFPLLTQEECQQNLALIDQFADSWIERIPGVPFYTLGAPLYIDKEGPEELYHERVLAMNTILQRHFKELLDTVRHCLEQHLQTTLHDLPAVSLPGFHLFGSSFLFTQPLAKIHFDLQYQKITWPEPPSLDSIVSFTLPLILPEAGGGLNWWDIEFDTAHPLSEQEQATLSQSHAKNYLAYEVGTLVVHNGHLLHQIAPATTISFSDRRVTLQGHALRVGGNYYWYW